MLRGSTDPTYPLSPSVARLPSHLFNKLGCPNLASPRTPQRREEKRRARDLVEGITWTPLELETVGHPRNEEGRNERKWEEDLERGRNGVSDKNKWIVKSRKSTLGLKMKRIIPYVPLHAAASPIPWSPSSYERPSHWYRPPHHHGTEFDATESMSFEKYILATKLCSRHGLVW